MSAVVRMRRVHAAHGGPLRRYLLRLTTGDPYVADNLVQETMLRTWTTCRPNPRRCGRGCSSWPDGRSST
ncbi:hypothetical protein Val02_22950 [Virgisporangium aliadipatigenens]|uniref:Uncharacterized protein n=1 Tax=Virgisporangium aliadipatigenens TaxID=741659 RepID=A0A8J3YHL6_9ACTN|nr:sigma factor [Virgisporangium aliadipatigenens]GIJ45409.1 hypothetical protein Val02_22950 [Virgisporangium aliadipatigenens]